jgi:integrase
MPAATPILGEYLDQWLELQRSQLQPSTWLSYRANVESYLKPALGDTPLADLTAAQLTAFYARLQQSGGRRGQPLALRTVQYCHGVIHKALADAVRFETLSRNVAASAVLPKVDLRGDGVREVRSWSAEELRSFLGHTAGSPRHALWHVAAFTGLRRGELLGLRWDDVDIEGHALTVRRALSVVKRDARLKQPKTSRCRTLRLDVSTAALLERRRAEQERDSRSAAWDNEWNLRWTPTRRTALPSTSSAREPRRPRPLVLGHNRALSARGHVQGWADGVGDRSLLVEDHR